MYRASLSSAIQLEQVLLGGSSTALQVAQRVRAFVSQQQVTGDDPLAGVEGAAVTRRMYNILCGAISSVRSGH